MLENKETKKKLILLTNDDGIEAPGLYKLFNEINRDRMFDVKVVAPDKERSAAGHAITVFDPIPVWEEKRDGKFFGCAVEGTPADCVKLAVKAILDRKPDLVISGINRGSNVGENVIYSGTVSAATEGTVCGISSIAVSVDSLKDPYYDFAAKFAHKMATLIISKGGLPQKVLLNINIPNVPEEQIKGVKITCQSTAKLNDYFIKRIDPRGRDYYWMDGDFVEVCQKDGDDYSAVNNRFVSITPIHYDMTDYEKIEYFKNWEIDKNI